MRIGPILDELKGWSIFDILYKLYEAMMLHQRNVHIKLLIFYQGGKYTSREFESYLAKQGTKNCLTINDTPESNGITEHLNCTLVERAHAMLLESSLPKTLWGYTICMWIISRIACIQEPYQIKCLTKWFIIRSLTYTMYMHWEEEFM